jgi:exoribonuclease-2
VSFGPDKKIRDYRVTEALIKLTERISYETADERIQSGTKESLMFSIASELRSARLRSGALIFKDPELSVHVQQDGEIEVNVRDRESPSQILVSELMIFANSLFAKYLKENHIAGLFRSQPPPLEKVELPEEYDPIVSYRSKKVLSRGDLSTTPAPHSTLGLEAYTTGTSPLRRYPDLLFQRQIKSFLRTGAPALSRAELESILDEISAKLDRAAFMERERQKYFLLKFFEKKRHETFDTIVLQRFPRFYLVQILEFGFNAALHVPSNLSLSAYDRVTAKIEKINPREEKITLSFVKMT